MRRVNSFYNRSNQWEFLIILRSENKKKNPFHTQLITRKYANFSFASLTQHICPDLEPFVASSQRSTTVTPLMFRINAAECEIKKKKKKKRKVKANKQLEETQTNKMNDKYDVS